MEKKKKKKRRKKEREKQTQTMIINNSLILIPLANFHGFLRTRTFVQFTNGFAL